MRPSKRLGGVYLREGRCRFRLWAPYARAVEVHILSPKEQVAALHPAPLGYHHGVVEGVGPGTRYLYRLDHGIERPDPASEFQPEGVHGPSEIVEPSFPWEDEAWRGLRLEELIIYEVHVGTFSPAGTFAGVTEQLDELVSLGITAVELMPVAQFPGTRNWGYDGVYPFAVHNSYGGPQGLKEFVNACHKKGLSVILDVVYNHLGPEGNYLSDFGPYFTERYRTPWGPAINFDGPWCDEVRRFFLENALYWITEFHVDGLRVDAIHGMPDSSARPFLRELTSWVHRRGRVLGRMVHVIAESDLNDPRVVRPKELVGLGFDAQWNDDFHHAIHSLLTGEKHGYYEDFGRLRHLVRALEHGFVYQGQYSRYRKRRHGDTSRDIGPRHMVVFSQNHDQVGNRALGERLSVLLDLEGLKLAAALVLLSPFVPLLFMGEEYGETAPFLYFTSHGDPDLVEAVRRGRQEEFSHFIWKVSPPDPQDKTTYVSSRLQRGLSRHGHHEVLLRFYKALITLRKEISSRGMIPGWEVKEIAKDRVLLVRSFSAGRQVAKVYHFGEDAFRATVPLAPGSWHKKLDSWEAEWMGPGSTVPSSLESGGQVVMELPCRGMTVMEMVEG